MKRPIRLTLAASAALILLGACAEPVGPRTQTGAATGAILGGLFGATRNGDDRLAKAAVGAAIGAAIGGGIGQQLDRQAGELRQDFGSDEIDVINTGSELIVRMPQDILFAVDSATIGSGLQSDLRVLANSLGRYPGSTVDIVGHTDNTGSSGYNFDLSTRRAQSVARVLVDAGVSSARLRTFGQGEDAPIASNLTPEGRAQNRRVDITIRPQA